MKPSRDVRLPGRGAIVLQELAPNLVSAVQTVENGIAMRATPSTMSKRRVKAALLGLAPCEPVDLQLLSPSRMVLLTSERSAASRVERVVTTTHAPARSSNMAS